MKKTSITGSRLRLRKSFGSMKTPLEIPNLIGLQHSSYEKFLQKDIPPEKRQSEGLQGVFQSVFPISDYSNTVSLEFVKYSLSHPKYEVKECLQRGMTYASPLRVTLRLVIFEPAKEGEEKTIRDVKEQEVYLSDIPLMTDHASFIINGTERVVVSQLHRSPGVFFDHDSGKTSVSGKYLYNARVIPYRGSWLDFEFDQKDIVNARIDRKRKFPATILLKALGFSTDQILADFHNIDTVRSQGDQITRSFDIEKMEGQRLTSDIRDTRGFDIILTSAGPNLKDARKAIQSLTDLDKEDTEILLEDPLQPIKTGIQKEEAEKIKAALEKTGAKAEIKPAAGKVLGQAGRRITRSMIRKVKQSGVREMKIRAEDLKNAVTAKPVFNSSTGEIILESNMELTPEIMREAISQGVSEFPLIFFDSLVFGPYISNTLKIDEISAKEDALIEIYKRMRPGEPPAIEAAEYYLRTLFFDPAAYDLGPVGRVKINHRFQWTDIANDYGLLTNKDILKVIQHLVDLRNGKGQVDDIDHLGNRRVRSVGELLENQYRIGLVRMERLIRERMSLQDTDTMMPHDLINAKSVGAAVKEFFGSSQLSQFMDQTNPLAEITHKRRLSAFGPGGLTRERAGFEVRDVHPTHYGRICPIETPEGPNIGLIVSLATFARVNEYGFIETPYRQVKEAFDVFLAASPQNKAEAAKALQSLIGLEAENAKSLTKKSEPKAFRTGASKTEAEKIKAALEKTGAKIEIKPSAGGKVKYYSALEEQSHPVVQARADFKKFTKDRFLTARVNGEYKTVKKSQVELMDVSPGQLVSIAASLVPFLEHDDANRALMGSNMQRQAVPLVRAKAPLVGTGMERLVARDSGNSVVCRHEGIVEDLDASRIVVRRVGKKGKLGASADIYDLIKYQRTNQNTCFNQKPIVKMGDRLKKGDIIADGLSMESGELALGRNIVVAFMPWAGYNFEDSILISEKLIKEDVYTSIHVEVFECLARDTKLGREEITDDIPNAGDEALRDLDSSGIIHVGAKVRTGDILVGKVTPKAENQLSPEKKLVLAIFGEKAGEVKDTSLRVPAGVSGTVIDTQIYSREGVEKSERLEKIIEEKKEKLKKDLEIQKSAVRNNALDAVKEILTGQKTSDILLSDDGSRELLGKGQKVTESGLKKIPFELLAYIPLVEESASKKVTEIIDGARSRIDELETVFQDRSERLSAGDELLPGVVKMIKVYVAVKHKAQIGDKFAGRHGNKGVISKILPEEDMPYMADGTPVDMVLNPLGVPSRMNIGQILETHLGWAAYSLGRQLQKYIENFQEEETRKALKKAYGNDEEISQAIEAADALSLKQLVKKAGGGIHVATPVFDGAKEADVKSFLKQANIPATGQTILFDGLTGESFEMPVTVGVMYMMKLHHLVEEKIHSRSIGPYSLVSQQPLGGKSQFGGQRLGEMEVWAIEAYGAAYCLQEFLTVKSDDVAGRVRMYESIVKGENILEPGIPESFNVLVNEMKSLGLNVEMFESDILTEAVKKTEGDEEDS